MSWTYVLATPAQRDICRLERALCQRILRAIRLYTPEELVKLHLTGII